MICDKCGKNNKLIGSKCTHCGAEMPKLSGNNGFADIFSYKPPVPVYSESQKISGGGLDSEAERMRALDMQKLINRSDKIINSTNKNTLFCIISVGLCVIILISSLIITSITNKRLDALTEKLNSVEQSEQSTKAELKTVLKELKKINASSKTKDDEKDSDEGEPTDDNEEDRGEGNSSNDNGNQSGIPDLTDIF
ncbi:MAG: hypothetical protein E7415_07060 [Ruminococcaceae bacterium]|nr:hypothetical protein [Oscillospiraceae bacterium]